MSKLDVVFCRRTRIPAKIAHVLTFGGVWGHCGVYDVARGVVIEALMFKGVVETPIDIWEAKYPSYTHIGMVCPDPERALRFARAQVDKGYDYRAVIAVPWRTSWEDPTRWYCSELVEACLIAGGRRRWRTEKWGISPTETWLVM